MFVSKRDKYVCNMHQLCLVNDFWTIPEQELCRERVAAISQEAIRIRIPKTPEFFNTEVLHISMRGEGKRMGAKNQSGGLSGPGCFIRCSSRVQIHRAMQKNQSVWIQGSCITMSYFTDK